MWQLCIALRRTPAATPGMSGMMSTSSLPLRRTARALLFDPANRLLLIQYEAARKIEGREPGDRLFWYTPGGGIDPGESAEQACRRELQEEVGLAEAVIGAEVALWHEPLTLFRRPTLTHARFFIVHAPDDRIDTSDLQATEQDLVHQVRWMSLQELELHIGSIVPIGLVPLVRTILAGHLPSAPVLLGTSA
jgi:8-oxo-dGTP pyrophosphatase MutT (NUDIX family)